MEKLSEQLVVADRLAEASTDNGTTTETGSDIDMRDHHDVIAYGLVDWTTTAGTTNVSATVKLQASTSTGFGDPVAVATESFASASATTTGATTVTVSANGEDVQAARADEDRYVRAVMTLKSGAASHTVTGEAVVLADRSRFKPASV